jgi:hypothetical protein
MFYFMTECIIMGINNDNVWSGMKNLGYKSNLTMDEKVLMSIVRQVSFTRERLRPCSKSMTFHFPIQHP